MKYTCKYGGNEVVIVTYLYYYYLISIVTAKSIVVRAQRNIAVRTIVVVVMTRFVNMPFSDCYNDGHVHFIFITLIRGWL